MRGSQAQGVPSGRLAISEARGCLEDMTALFRERLGGLLVETIGGREKLEELYREKLEELQKKIEEVADYAQSTFIQDSQLHWLD
jgi:hypothetical protein